MIGGNDVYFCTVLTACADLDYGLWPDDIFENLVAGSFDGPVVAVNPGSLLGTKMVKEAFGTVRGEVGIGADILCRAALDDEFADASGKYFDNDSGRFATPHPDALDTRKIEKAMNAIEAVLAEKVSGC